jgi:hypothetical protein
MIKNPFFGKEIKEIKPATPKSVRSSSSGEDNFSVYRNNCGKLLFGRQTNDDKNSFNTKTVLFGQGVTPSPK